MMIRSVTGFSALAAACALSLFAAGVSAQQISLPLGGVLGTNELGTKLANEVRKLEQSIDVVRTELFEERRKVQALASELKAEKDRSDENARTVIRLLEDLTKRSQEQALQLQQLRADSDRRISEIATVFQRELEKTNAGLSKIEGDSAALRGELSGLPTLVTDLQGDRRRLESELLSLKVDHKNLQTTVTQLESRKSEIEALQNESSQLRESSKLELNKVLAEMRAITDNLSARLVLTENKLEEAKRDFGSQVKVTQDKVSVIERSTAPVAVEIDGRTFEALPADRDSYSAAVARVVNAPKAKAPREEYEAARADLQKFLDSVPNPGFRGSAFYWLGMAQFGAGQCREAQVSFEEMRKLVDTARHPRYPSAMLQRATCQIALKEPQERINRSLRELIDQFPGSAEADSAKALLPPVRRQR